MHARAMQRKRAAIPHPVSGESMPRGQAHVADTMCGGACRPRAWGPVGIPGAPGALGSSGDGGKPSGPCVWGPESLALELSQGLRISGRGDGLVQRDCPTGSLGCALGRRGMGYRVGGGGAGGTRFCSGHWTQEEGRAVGSCPPLHPPPQPRAWHTEELDQHRRKAGAVSPGTLLVHSSIHPSVHCTYYVSDIGLCAGVLGTYLGPTVCQVLD